MDWINNLKFDEKGLIPAIVQNIDTGEILMHAYMNKESLNITFNTGHVTFWSRSRQKLWTKGETSGHFLNLKEIFYDCDLDTLLIKASPIGPTCHTGNKTCFFRKADIPEIIPAKSPSSQNI